MFGMLIILSMLGCSGDSVTNEIEVVPSISIQYPADGFSASGDSRIQLKILSKSPVDSVRYVIVGKLDSIVTENVDRLKINFNDRIVFVDGETDTVSATWWGKDGTFSDTSVFTIKYDHAIALKSESADLGSFNTTPAFAISSNEFVAQSSYFGNMEIIKVRAIWNDAIFFPRDDTSSVDPPPIVENLSNHPAPDLTPFYGKLSERIFYVSLKNSVYNLWSMNYDGEDKVQLTDDSETELFPSLNPDETTVVYEKFGSEESDIWILTLQDTSSRILVDWSGADGHPVFNRSGGEVLFHSNHDGTFDIWSVSTTGGDPRILIDWNSNEKNPSVSPDGESLVFTSDRAGSNDIWLYDFATGNSRQLTATSDGEDFASFNALGTEIVYAVQSINGWHIYRKRVE